MTTTSSSTFTGVLKTGGISMFSIEARGERETPPPEQLLLPLLVLTRELAGASKRHPASRDEGTELTERLYWKNYRYYLKKRKDRGSEFLIRIETASAYEVFER
ncbi:hypothetical protein HAX54_032055 [Datura stramonium]|uniref:Uncharacterized protein n=1 Tax=Datura stramonium TaxID=4076 RepID=A0ABS8VCP1_DATST|nr:hypothetical protein [Datura stramonium]